MPVTSLSDWLFTVVLFTFLAWLHAVLLLLLPGRRAMRIVAAVLFTLASVCAYFSDTLRIVIDRDMIRNVVETDITEASSLLNGRLIAYLAVLGLLPVLAVSRLSISVGSCEREVTRRGLFIVIGVFGLCGAMLPFTAQMASFVREHRPLRAMIHPASVLYATTTYLRGEMQAPPATAEDLDGTETRVAGYMGPRPIVVVLVIGETARATDFQLFGHGRPTNPRLAALNDLYRFERVTSCGTATAVSLPCIFSDMGRESFDVTVARGRTNLLDSVAAAGVSVEWRDNNSGCKGICGRVVSQDMSKHLGSGLCTEDYCFDEILLTGLTAAIQSTRSDQLKVLHQIGSHGPAYCVATRSTSMCSGRVANPPICHHVHSRRYTMRMTIRFSTLTLY